MDRNRAFAEKYGFPYDLLSDPARTMGVAYGAVASTDGGNAKRISYLIDADGKVARVYPKVTPADHAAQVLEDLKSLPTAGR